MNRLIILLLFTLAFSPLYSQYHSRSKKAIKQFETAVSLFDRRMDEEALKSLDKAIRSDRNFVEAYMMRAQILKDKGNYKAAVKDYEKALSIDPAFFPPGYFILARILYDMGDYQTALEKARFFFNKNDFRQVPKEEAEAFIMKAEWAVNSIQSPVPYALSSLGDSVNSERHEYWPSLSLDENTLFFTVLDPIDLVKPVGPGNMQEDFYFSSRKEQGPWSLRKNAGQPLNSKDNEGAQSISADGKTLYFTACNRPDGAGLCDIYVSFFRNGSWSKPLNLGTPVNTRFSDKHPSLSADGKTLYFSSDRPGGKGNLDIWMSVLGPNGRWSEPVNLSDSINTPGNEQSPFIHPDNATLYFTSEGHLNFGKDDIFLSRRNGKSWGKAKNLGYPINTHNREAGLIVNAAGDLAYFATDRENGKGLDLYSFPLYKEAQPTAVNYMSGKVFDKLTGLAVPAGFKLIDIASGDLQMDVSAEPGTGRYLVPLPGGKDYALHASHPGYLFYSEHFSFSGTYPGTDPFVKDIPLSPVRKGEKIILKNIFFDFDQFSLKPESITELDKIFEFLNQNPSIKAEISGHTDNRGTDEYNKKLSEQRAMEVCRYLEEKGIDRKRLSYKGYGEDVPVDTNDTEEGRALNRRTELLILE